VTIDDANQLTASALLLPGLAVQVLPVDDELVVFDPLRNKLFRLNGTATFIWRSIETAPNVAKLVEQVQSHYELAGRAAWDVVQRFVTDLIDLGIVSADNTKERDRTTARDSAR
jgi:hypothetical protein